jgi:hypothetical protein
MSYEQTGTRHSYQPKRAATMRASAITPASHEAFRREWDTNFDTALQKARELQKKGFLVEESLQHGALMESKAKSLAESLKQKGYEVELIPVAKWAGENVVFLIYKPTEKAKEAAEPKPKPTTGTGKEPTPQDIIDAFVKNFTYHYPSGPVTPDPSKLPTEGHIPDPKHIAALVDPASSSNVPTVDKLRTALKTMQPTVRFENSTKLRVAATRLNAQLKKKHGGSGFVTFDGKPDKTVDLDVFIRSLRSLGDGPMLIYAFPNRFDPFYLVREKPPHLAIALAPYIEPHPDKIVNFLEIEKEAANLKIGAK